MSKPLTYSYSGTKGHIAAVASSLPSDPSSLLESGWKDISDPKAANAGHMKIREKSTGFILGFDRGTPGAPGFREKIIITSLTQTLQEIVIFI